MTDPVPIYTDAGDIDPAFDAFVRALHDLVPSSPPVPLTDDHLHHFACAFIHPVTLPTTFRAEEFVFKKLEFLGDSVLYLSATDYLIDKYPAERVLSLDRKRRVLVSNHEGLERLATLIGMDQFVVQGTSCGKLLPSVMESFLGAMYQHQGYIYTHLFLTTLWDIHIEDLFTLFLPRHLEKAKLSSHSYRSLIAINSTPDPTSPSRDYYTELCDHLSRQGPSRAGSLAVRFSRNRESRHPHHRLNWYVAASCLARDGSISKSFAERETRPDAQNEACRILLAKMWFEDGGRKERIGIGAGEPAPLDKWESERSVVASEDEDDAVASERAAPTAWESGGERRRPYHQRQQQRQQQQRQRQHHKHSHRHGAACDCTRTGWWFGGGQEPRGIFPDSEEHEESPTELFEEPYKLPVAQGSRSLPATFNEDLAEDFGRASDSRNDDSNSDDYRASPNDSTSYSSSYTSPTIISVPSSSPLLSPPPLNLATIADLPLTADPRVRLRMLLHRGPQGASLSPAFYNVDTVGRGVRAHVRVGMQLGEGPLVELVERGDGLEREEAEMEAAKRMIATLCGGGEKQKGAGRTGMGEGTEEGRNGERRGRNDGAGGKKTNNAKKQMKQEMEEADLIELRDLISFD